MYADDNTWRRRLAGGAAIAMAVALVAAGCALAWMSLRGASAAGQRPVPLGQPLDPPAAPQALVFVSGAVAQPGLYRLSADARVADAVAAAGGLTPQADLGKLPNLAARVHDGKQVNVPLRRSTSTGAVQAADRLDVNSATVDELRALPGMPLGLPEAIVAARDSFGAFTSLSGLRTLLGLDSATYASIRPFLRVVVPAG